MNTDSQNTGMAMSVSAKIGIGFAIVLLLHLSIVVVGHYGLQQAEENRITHERLRSRVESLYQLDHTVGELQRNVLLYAFSGYQGTEQRVVALQNQLYTLLEAAENNAGEDEIGASVLASMRRRLDTHRHIYESVVTDRAHRRTLVDDRLRGLADQIRGALANPTRDSVNDAEVRRAESLFLSAQIKMMQFVHSPDSARVHGAKQDLADCRRVLGALASAGLTADDPGARALSLLDVFETEFLRMVQVTRGYLHLVNVVLAGEAQEFLRLADDARLRSSARADELSARMAAESGSFRRANNLFSAITIALGLLASYLIGRNVAPPLNAITTTLDKLAKGIKCKHIPGLGRRDELGRLAAAAQVFKDKAEQTESLLVEVTHMKELERQLAHSQKLESVGQLAAGIAHEINTPLQCVTNNIQYLKRACDGMLEVVGSCETLLASDGPNEEEARRLRAMLDDRARSMARTEIPEAVVEASDAVGRVVEIVHAMRCMSHPGTAELKPVDLNSVVQNSVKISRNHWKEQAEVSLDLEDGLPQPLAQSSELSQVILNLLVNAADAIGETRGQRDPLGKITVTTRSVCRHVVVEVSDTGAGIPDELKQRVFDPFFTTKEVGKGSGQGLALAYNVVVKRLQGTLGVESREGEGAKFTIRIPIASHQDDPDPGWVVEPAANA
ncbi:Sensor protein ZraS [Posidoniimonas polymericola]|uniref:histidine kinase n=1 Tax=Posidoniimonas polymericola TaxID=2528002 RepID=A0A5C5YD26_9BACT|nr:ATP-binding protein [Posidoniimonas polymericola]TWT73606.1 Sensor protein ZraS [Posidoniimonas polymericola]